jgi:hypothetical protein
MLKPNQIFVFGSNRRGRHGSGAAKVALDKYGAIYGQGLGLQGQSYGIPTKYEGRAIPSDTLELGVISFYVDLFIRFARDNPNLEFMVTAIGCGLAGHKAEDIAPMFAGRSENVKLPEEFLEVLLGREVPEYIQRTQMSFKKGIK